MSKKVLKVIAVILAAPVQNSDHDQDDIISRLSLSQLEDVEELDETEALEDDDEAESCNTNSVKIPEETSSNSVDTTSQSKSKFNKSTKNGEGTSGKDAAGVGQDSKKILEPLASFKKLLSGKKSTDKPLSKRERLAQVTVESLPQKFIVKYLGARPCVNLWGSKTSRPLIDDLLAELKARSSGTDLPLLSLVVNQSGFEAKAHRKNTATKLPTNLGTTPLEFVSYATQDTRYSRVAAVIIIKEMSARSKKVECRGYLCDSDITARRLALSFNLSFQTYAAKLNGQPYKFHVNLNGKNGDASGKHVKASVDCEA